MDYRTATIVQAHLPPCATHRQGPTSIRQISSGRLRFIKALYLGRWIFIRARDRYIIH
jgi:hypothetical protein